MDIEAKAIWEIIAATVFVIFAASAIFLENKWMLEITAVLATSLVCWNACEIYYKLKESRR